MGRLTTPGQVDLRPVFTALYRAWVQQGHGSSLADLADQLRAVGARYTRHSIARFVDRGEPTSPHAARQPPLWLLLALCERTSMVLELTPDSIRLRSVGTSPETPC